MQSLDSKNAISWRRRARKVLVRLLGGCCAICGYTDDFDGAFDIHHIDPSTKEFSIGKLNKFGLHKCIEEARKCVLLCAICHRKIHAGLLSTSAALYYFDTALAEQYLERKGNVPTSVKALETRKKWEKNYTCTVCGVPVVHGSILCRKCRGITQRRVKRPDIATLIAEVEELGYKEAAKKYGVSDNAIRKWIKS